MKRLRWILPLLLVLGGGVGYGLHAREKHREQAECAREIAEAGRPEAAREPIRADAGEAEREREAEGEKEECAAEMNRELTLPFDAYLTRQISGSDITPPQAYKRALRRTAALPSSEGAWQFVGPTNIGGRVLDIALDGDDPNTIYAATAGGGVMKSTDGGVSFVSSWPSELPQAIGALSSAPDGALYAGTGEAGPGGGALTFGGTGIYKSTDDGATWTNIGLENSVRIGRIVLDPTNPQRIFVAALGNLFTPTEDRGLYRSEDGGKTWTKVLAGDNGTTGVADVAIDPKDPKRMLATTWDAQRTPAQRRYTGPGSGVYRSTDSGATWTRIATPLLANDEIGRIGVAIDPQKPDTTYFIASGLVGNHIGFFKSTDFGTTLVPQFDPDQFALDGAFTYGWWFGRVWVDPNDSNRVFVAGVGLLRSTDGGATFDVVNGEAHADQHALVWDARVPGRVWLGNDGGVYRSDDNESSFQHAEVEPFSQPDSLDVSEQDPTRIVAGLQDNGQIRSWPDDWNSFGGGDGQRVLIDPTDQEVVYGCSQNGACTVSTDGGKTNNDFSNQVVSARKPFFAPIEFDPKDPKTLYAGGEMLNRSDDRAQTWTPISPDLSNGPSTEETNPLYAKYGSISAIGAAPKETGTLYVGTDDGNVQYTHSGGGPAGWTKATSEVLPKAWVNKIAVKPTDDKTAYVAFSGFRSGDKAAYLVKTTDGGETFTNHTGDLPHVPIQDVEIVDDSTLAVATDVGVFASKDDGAHWYRVGSGLPQLPAYEMKVHRGSDTLFVATFGRSIWKVALASVTAGPRISSTPKPKKRFLGLPKRRRCGKALRFRIHQKGFKFVRGSARVAGFGKVVKRTTRKALRRPVTLKVPKRAFTAKVTARTAKGKTLRAKRRYKGC
jgi:photosystem II stability/assembly factor-like uncharacterized protein